MKQKEGRLLASPSIAIVGFCLLFRAGLLEKLQLLLLFRIKDRDHLGLVRLTDVRELGFLLVRSQRSVVVDGPELLDLILQDGLELGLLVIGQVQLRAELLQSGLYFRPRFRVGALTGLRHAGRLRRRWVSAAPGKALQTGESQEEDTRQD